MSSHNINFYSVPFSFQGRKYLKACLDGVFLESINAGRYRDSLLCFMPDESGEWEIRANISGLSRRSELKNLLLKRTSDIPVKTLNIDTVGFTLDETDAAPENIIDTFSEICSELYPDFLSVDKKKYLDDSIFFSMLESLSSDSHRFILLRLFKI